MIVYFVTIREISPPQGRYKKKASENSDASCLRRERLVSLIRYMVENIGKKRLVFAFFKNLF